EGVVGNKLSVVEESFADGSLEHALYTRPRKFEGQEVPDALVSGDPTKIEKFKSQSKREITKKYRPDLQDD
ncbi:MAG: tRNA (guanosine(37)-N1)-methyltransferase TrmD, partial [Bacteriovoracaceae bacterium]